MLAYIMSDLVNEMVPLMILSHSLKWDANATKLTQAERKT